MSTLAEIEAAVDQLPVAEQKALLQFIAEHVHRSEASEYDPDTEIIGASPSGAPNDTGRRVRGYSLRRRRQMDSVASLDTGAIYSLADPCNHDHAAVRAVYNDPERTFILHGLILVEACSLPTKRLHKQAALRTVGAIRLSPRVEKSLLTPALLEAR